MGRIVLRGPQNSSLDGVVQAPDGAEGFRTGGWFVELAGMGAEAWLLGRASYAFFGSRWRTRTRELADRLNGMPKYVVSAADARR